MKFYRCPECHREKFYKKNLVCVVCPGCQIEMEVIEDDK